MRSDPAEFLKGFIWSPSIPRYQKRADCFTVRKYTQAATSPLYLPGPPFFFATSCINMVRGFRHILDKHFMQLPASFGEGNKEIPNTQPSCPGLNPDVKPPGPPWPLRPLLHAYIWDLLVSRALLRQALSEGRKKWPRLPAVFPFTCD